MGPRAKREPPRGALPGRVRRLAALASALALVVVAHGSNAATMVSESDACAQAIASIEPGSGIPPNLLAAISRVESGRPDPRDGRVKAWPWTVNAEGRGDLFAGKPEAMSAVLALRARGVMSVDVGCMQVNLMHHPAAFGSLDDAFDPMSNVRYAAAFLRALHDETGDWSLAAAYYHSRSPERMRSYQAKVMAQLPGTSPIALRPARRNALAEAWAATMQTAAPPLLASASARTMVFERRVQPAGARAWTRFVAR